MRTQNETRTGRREHAGRDQQQCVLHLERAVHRGTGADRKEGDEERGHRRLHLDERNVADDHVHQLLLRGHVAEIGLSGQPTGQAHVQVALETDQRGHEDEELADRLEHLPVL